MASSCPNLQTVDISDCVGVADEAVQALARCCRRLQVLSLSGCPAVGDVGLQALAENCSLLHTLILSGTRVLSPQAVKEHMALVSCSGKRAP